MIFLYIQFFDTVIILLLLWCLLSKSGRRQCHQLRRTVKHTYQREVERRARQWRPKTPHDCPHCCAGLQLEVARINHDVRPWSSQKGKGGPKKQFDTRGFACLNQTCPYFGITDPAIHALVKDTDRGKDKDIPQLKCQCCRKRFSSRKGTPLYHLKKKTKDVEMVMFFMAEGVDISVMVRYTGYAESTIARWLTKAGEHSPHLHDILFRGWVIPLVQMDELYAKVRGIKQGRGLWVVIDPVSKVLPSIHVGGRKADDGHALIHDFAQRLDPECVPAVTTDGFRPYFSSLTAHFGKWIRPLRARKDHWQVDDRLLHGQLVKRRKSRKLVYTLTRMRWGKQKALYTVLEAQGFNKTIQTAFIERVNLTIRQGVSLLARRTWSLAQSEEHLLLHVQWWRAYYHLARQHESLKGQTPAMAIGVTDHRWTVGEILRTPLPPRTLAA